MELISVIATFFAILGGLALLNELLEHVPKRKRWTELNRDKRALLIIILSMITTPIAVKYSGLRKERTGRALSILRELEIQLTQIESILNNIIVSNASGAPVNLLNKLAEYLLVYGARAQHSGIALRSPNWAAALGKEKGERLESAIRSVRSQIQHW